MRARGCPSFHQSRYQPRPPSGSIDDGLPAPDESEQVVALGMWPVVEAVAAEQVEDGGTRGRRRSRAERSGRVARPGAAARRGGPLPGLGDVHEPARDSQAREAMKLAHRSSTAARVAAGTAPSRTTVQVPCARTRAGRPPSTACRAARRRRARGRRRRGCAAGRRRGRGRRRRRRRWRWTGARASARSPARPAAPARPGTRRPTVPGSGPPRSGQRRAEVGEQQRERAGQQRLDGRARARPSSGSAPERSSSEKNITAAGFSGRRRLSVEELGDRPPCCRARTPARRRCSAGDSATPPSAMQRLNVSASSGPITAAPPPRARCRRGRARLDRDERAARASATTSRAWPEPTSSARKARRDGTGLLDQAGTASPPPGAQARSGSWRGSPGWSPAPASTYGGLGDDRVEVGGTPSSRSERRKRRGSAAARRSRATVSASSLVAAQDHEVRPLVLRASATAPARSPRRPPAARRQIERGLDQRLGLRPGSARAGRRAARRRQALGAEM